MRNSAFSVL